MGSFSDAEEEYRFFDANESIASSISDLGSDIPECSSTINHGVSTSFPYDMWIRSPRSVQERRSRFFSWMESTVDIAGGGEFNRVMECSGAVLRALNVEDEFSSSRLSVSSCSSHGCNSLRSNSKENFEFRNGNSGTGDLQSYASPPSSSIQLAHRKIGPDNNMVRTMSRMKNRWLSRLKSMTCIVDGEGDKGDDLRLRTNGSNPIRGLKAQRVRARHCNKQSKELSALFIGQDFQAHNGSILTMKFSADGRFLASAGEDGVVRVWQVVEDERSNEVDIPDIDPSCVYFTVNRLSELAPLVSEGEKMSKSKSLKKTEDSACVIFPPKVFRILEKPLHEFHGHGGEILDLSWSRSHFLLSCSVDKTVRLWQVGCDQCVRVFAHSNYVTCVQVNPMDENYFISGSIDGKVRIWAIDNCQVVDWTDIRDIVTALSYRPDGQGGIIGSLTGNCRSFSVTDNQFQLESLICLNNKKKSPSKRITGFQFFPQDPSKVMVTCADSHIRILQGTDMVGKYRGSRNSGNQISASLSPDGKHIVSACEDSNVYVWNCMGPEESSLPHPKTNRSFESFSTDASVAIPWSGLKTDESSPLPFSSSSSCFSLDQEFFLESIPKGSATWPEEKLPRPRPVGSALRKSQYKFFKTSCQSSSSSHWWGLVIVTAGWDGRIRSFHNYGLPVNR